MNILATTQLPPSSLRGLPSSLRLHMFTEPRPMPRDQLLNTLKEGHFDGLICTYKDRIDEELLGASPTPLKLVATLSAGRDHIDAEACAEWGATLISAPNLTTDDVADFGMALVLMGARRLDRFLLAPPVGPWHYLWECQGASLSRHRAGIIGLGNIGGAIARRLAGFGCPTRYTSRSPKPNLEATLGVSPMPLPELLETSTIVIITCALTKETTGLINKEALALMAPGSILVNLARGPIIDHDALSQGLNAGRPAVALLDTTEPEPLPPEHPLRHQDNCLIFPHIATNTATSRQEIADHILRQVLTHLPPG